MNHFQYKDGVLHAEDVSLDALAQSVGTPFYCYSTATLSRHFQVFKAALPPSALIAYAMKANDNLAVLKTLANLGAGADIVSGGELRKALAAGIPGERIVFSGVGKSREEMRAALEANIFQFNVESEPELEALDSVARDMGRKAPVTIRVNPDVDALTHAKISTGKGENKFGVPIDWVPGLATRASKMDGIRLVGVATHIGSQLTNLEPLRAAWGKIIALIADLRAAGHKIERCDLGGGLGVPYELDNAPPPEPELYGRLVAELTKGLDVKLVFEPGRLIVANAGILVSRVLYVKPGAAKNFLVLDAAMNDLIRPAMYDAHHDIVPVRDPGAAPKLQRYDVVGPICETGDLFAHDRDLPGAKAGDLMALMTAGAYGAVMSSSYNARLPAPEVLVSGQKWSVVRPRITYEALIALDRIPDWLEDGERTQPG